MNEDRRNIHIILDMSLSMMSIASCVYIFLLDLLRQLMKETDYHFNYQVTWFTEEAQTMVWKNQKNYTEDFTELVNRLKVLPFPVQQVTRSDSAGRAIRHALQHTSGNPEEQILLVFTDTAIRGSWNFAEDGPVRRVFLFLPQGNAADVQFSFVNQLGNAQIGFPVIQMPIESLAGSDCPIEEAYKCLKQLM